MYSKVKRQSRSSILNLSNKCVYIFKTTTVLSRDYLEPIATVQANLPYKEYMKKITVITMEPEFAQKQES